MKEEHFFTALCAKCGKEIERLNGGGWVHKHNQLGLCFESWPCYQELNEPDLAVERPGGKEDEMPKGKKSKKKKK